MCWNLAMGIWLLAVGILLLTVACSKESEQTVTPTPAPSPSPSPSPSPNPGGGGGTQPADTTQTPDPKDTPLWMVAATRASDSGISDAADNYDFFSPIQIFLVSGSSETAITQKREGLFVYEPEGSKKGWSSTIGLKDANNYIYGFSPADAASCTISPLSGTSYHTGAILSMKNVRAASGSDLCVVIGVRYATNKETANAIPIRGTFSFGMGDENYISLLLDHVFARLDFKVKVGEYYSKQRAIKIKKLELQSANELKEVRVSLLPGVTEPTNNPKVTYETAAVADGATKPTGVVYDFTTDSKNPTGQEVTTEGIIFPGYFAPDAESKISKGLSLICTYDVYSINSNNIIGTRVRENCVAVNSLAGIDLSSVTRGKKTTLTLTVEPTYLYQLSDDELDNPGIRLAIENDNGN